MRDSPQVSDSVAAIAATESGPRVGAFFDLDGTLVAGFTAMAHAGERIRRGQASIGEVLGILEASVRYRFGRMEFERLLIRAAGYLRGELISDLTNSASCSSNNTSDQRSTRTCARSCR